MDFAWIWLHRSFAVILMERVSVNSGWRTRLGWTSTIRKLRLFRSGGILQNQFRQVLTSISCFILGSGRTSIWSAPVARPTVKVASRTHFLNDQAEGISLGSFGTIWQTTRRREILAIYLFQQAIMIFRDPHGDA